MLRSLRQDPSLRLTEVGRDLLRLLEACPIDDEQAGRIINGVPAHWKDTVVDLARECAVAWREFANQLAARANVSA